jgi:hypothetical protein
MIAGVATGPPMTAAVASSASIQPEGIT